MQESTYPTCGVEETFPSPSGSALESTVARHTLVTVPPPEAGADGEMAGDNDSGGDTGEEDAGVPLPLDDEAHPASRQNNATAEADAAVRGPNPSARGATIGASYQP